MATGVTLCWVWRLVLGVRAGGWQRWRLQGFELVSQRPTATNLRKVAKSEHLRSSHPLLSSFSVFFLILSSLLCIGSLLLRHICSHPLTASRNIPEKSTINNSQ